MKYGNLKGSLILITAAIVWGLAFTAQSLAGESVPPFTVNALRSFISAVVLYGFYRLRARGVTKRFLPYEPEKRKFCLAGGIVCGLCLAVSVNFQQFGIAAYPSGAAAEARSGFITALYVIMVPLFSAFAGRKIRLPVWIGAVIAIAGFYLLCFSGGMLGIYLGDALVLLCALGFTFHIMAVDKYVEAVGGIRLSVLQFAVCGTASSVLALLFERNTVSLDGIISAALPIIYLGVISSGLGYTLQIIGQKYAEPSVASVSMSLESVFAALGGWLISGNALSLREIAGCALVFAANITAQLTPKTEKITGTE